MKLCNSNKYSYTILHLNVALHNIGWFFVIRVRSSFDSGFFLLNRMHLSDPQENEYIIYF